MDLKTVLLVGLSVGLIAAAILLWPSGDAPIPLTPKAEIVVEGTSIEPWRKELEVSARLAKETVSVLPRVQIWHAVTSGLAPPLQQSTEMERDAKQTAQRILVEHAATATSVPMGATTPPVVAASARVLIEHAATALPIGALSSSSGLQSDSAKVSPKLLIEDAEIVDTTLLEAMPPDPPGR
jgi:hypothetical protein